MSPASTAAGLAMLMALQSQRLGEFCRLLGEKLQPWQLGILNRLQLRYSGPNTWVGRRRAKRLRQRGIDVIYSPQRTGPMRWGYVKFRPLPIIVP